MLQRLPLRSRLGLAVLVLVFGVAMHGLTWWGQARLGAQVAADARPGDIHLLASVSCVDCAEARAWFTENRVPFTECLIERDAQCAAIPDAPMAPGASVLLVRGKRLAGFSAQAVADALATR
jgi:hypothetical protein